MDFHSRNDNDAAGLLDHPPSAGQPARAPAGILPRLRGLVFSRRLEIGLLSVIPAAFLVQPDGMGHWKIRIAVSLAMLVAGMLLRIWAGGCAGSHTGDSQIQAPRLATGGPYAHVRNPIYLGTILIGLGMVGLIGDSRLLPICLLTFAILYTLIVPAEEKFLRAAFGVEYDRYADAVPRVCPRLTRWKQGQRVPFNWGILKNEARIAAVLVFVYAVMELAAHLK